MDKDGACVYAVKHSATLGASGLGGEVAVVLDTEPDIFPKVHTPERPSQMLTRRCLQGGSSKHCV